MNRLTQNYASCIREELSPGSRNFLQKPIFVQLVTILSALCGTRSRIFLFTSSDFWTTYWARWIHSTPSHSTNLRFKLILSSYLSPGLVMVSYFTSCISVFMPLSSLLCWLPAPSHFPSFDEPSIYIWLKPPIMKLIIMFFLLPPVTSTNLSPSTELRKFFWITNVYSLRKVSGRCMMLGAVPIWFGRCGWCETVKWQLPTREKKSTLGAYQEKQMVAR